MKYDVLVYIGRFEPPHNGHKAVIEYALTQSKKVLVICGSANRPRTPKNPFTYTERHNMIRGMFPAEFDAGRLQIAASNDYIYNDQKWVIETQNIVRQFSKTSDKIGIIGGKKDYSSYYLDLFPQWEWVDIQEVVFPKLNATDVRATYLKDVYETADRNIKPLVPENVFEYLKDFRHNPAYTYLAGENGAIVDYKKSWEKAPYPPIFMTVDAVVIQSGHILLIRRKHAPGRDLLALPGGFLNQHERTKAGMLRELREETKLKVPEPVLKGHIKADKIFDAVDRSLRGRTITHAFLIQLPAGPLPKVKGSDDAKEAMWIPISELKSIDMFEDHYDIITYLLGRV